MRTHKKGVDQIYHASKPNNGASRSCEETTHIKVRLSRSPADGPTHDDVSAYFRLRMNLLCQIAFVFVSFVLRCVVHSVVENGWRICDCRYFPLALFELVYALKNGRS